MESDHDSAEAIEGRLHAHRQIVAALVAAVLDARPDTAGRLRDLVSRDAVAADQAEDPGAIPDRAFAIAAATAEELRLIAREVARLRRGAEDAGEGPGPE